MTAIFGECLNYKSGLRILILPPELPSFVVRKQSLLPKVQRLRSAFICIFCGCIFVFVFVSFLWWETWESCLLCGEESFSHILLWNKFAIHGFSCLRPHQSTHVICYCNILETSFKTLFNFIISFISTYTRWWLFFHFTFTSPLNV